MSSRTNDPGVVTEPASGVASVQAGSTPDEHGHGWRKRPRQTRVVIRKVGPWSVLKFSLLFYFCIMLVILLALGMIYWVLGTIGALDSVTRLARELFSDKTFAIHGDWIFKRLTVIGLGMVVVWSVLNVFVAFLYNLIADVVGGVEVTLAERR